MCTHFAHIHLYTQVDVTVLPAQEASGLGELAQSLIFPAALFAGLFFLSRRGAGGMPGGGGGGPGNPMGFGKSKAQYVPTGEKKP